MCPEKIRKLVRRDRMPSDAEIASQCGGLEPFIECSPKAGSQILRLAIYRLTAVSEVFFHKVRAIADI